MCLQFVGRRVDSFQLFFGRRWERVTSKPHNPAPAVSRKDSFMASLYRPWIVRYLDAAGNRVNKSAPEARKLRERSKTYHGKFRNANGKVCRVSLCSDKEAAGIMLNELVCRARNEKIGVVNPFESHQKMPLTKHLDEFEAALRAKEVSEDYVKLAVFRARRVVTGCGFQFIRDLSASKVQSFLADLKAEKKLSTQTINFHLAAVKMFGRWLAKDRRIPDNPFAYLSGGNPKLDPRHVRRELSADELASIIAGAGKSADSFRGLTGPDRRMLYAVAA